MNGTHIAVAPPIAQAAAHAAGIDRSRTWRRLTFASAGCVTLLDVALLQRKHGLFTGGFLASHQFGTFVDSVAFLMVSALVNTAMAAPVVAVALIVGRWLGLKPRAAKFAALATAVLPLAVADFISYKVWSYIGDAFDFHVMYSLTGRRISEVFAITTPLMSQPMYVFALGLGAIAVFAGMLHRFDRRHTHDLTLPLPRRVLLRCTALILLASIVVTMVAMNSDAMAFAMRQTPSGQIFTVGLNELSDIDGDGYGLLRTPRDEAALDAAIHPYALDVPGNGIDENGLGGDLPEGAVHAEARVPAGPWPRTPPVILFVLESVRADVVGASYNGRPVTPIINGLATQGMRVDSAWSHAGSTALSRYHILTGSLVAGNGRNTLLDDFKTHGYDVAYFSGQNDDFGSLGLDFSAVDTFYDATKDVSHRYSTSTTPGSLAVPLDVVERRLNEYLASRRSESPLFLYVNFHDTHYPYHHAGLQNLLDVEPLPAYLISPGRRGELTRTYLNTMANVDGAIGRVIAAVESRLGQRAAVIVVGDHGESLFEQGFLGHGFALNDAQTRVPLIVRGLGMRVAVPFGLSDLRQAINLALVDGTGTDQPSQHRSTSARVFQFVGSPETPRQIGWMTPNGSITYDFRSERISVWDGEVTERDLIAGPRRLFQELVHSWERLLLAGRSKSVD